MSMGAVRRWSVLGLFGCAALFGCQKTSVLEQRNSEAADAEGEVRDSSQAVTLPTVTVTLPPNGALGVTPLAANGTLVLKDRSSVKSPGAVNLPLYNAGTGTTEIGVGTTTASVTSKGSVFMRNNARVQGTLVTGGSLTKQAGAVVTLTTTQFAPIPAPLTTTWTVPFVATPSLPQTVTYDGTGSLAPGSYGKLTVLNHGTMTLSSGVYAFSDLQLEWDSTLRLEFDQAKGPIIIYLDAFSAFRGSVIGVNGDPAESLLLVYRGTATARMERTAPMALVAPLANIEFGTGGVTHRGSFYAQGISLDPDVKLVHVPFKYWNWREPPTPIVSCVFPSGRGKYSVAFGYQNPSLAALSAPLGLTNRLTPGPASPSPPISLLPGVHDRTFWATMTGETLTWNLFGKTAVATHTSPRCEFGESPIDDPAPVFSEGRPIPRPNTPPVPAPRLEPAAGENASGPGRFAGMIPPKKAALGGGDSFPGPPEVSDPILTAILGAAPDIPDGVQFQSVPIIDPSRQSLVFTMETQVPSEGWPENTDLRINGTFKDQPDLQETGVTVVNNVGTFGRGFTVPADSLFDLTVHEVEYNLFSDHESFILRLVVNPTSGAFIAEQESGRITKTWLFGTPIVISGYNQLDLVTTTGMFGDTKEFTFHGDNHVTWKLAGAPVETEVPFTEEDRVPVCLNWTAYFVDEGLPSLDGVTEEFVGKELEGNLRVRGYPASFASYELATKGTTGSHKRKGRLDESGCIPGGVATAGLAYRPEITDGSLGGVSFHVKLIGTFRHPDLPPKNGFKLYEQNPDHPATHEFHFTRFDDQPGWTNVGGLLLPPTSIEISAPYRDAVTTTAAVVSHLTRRLADEGVVFGSEENPTLIELTVDGGYLSGTYDYQGNEVRDSAARGTTLSIGPAYFPCADIDETPDGPGQSCARRPCLGDMECSGGQHCARASDPADGCVDGEECYCARPDQGTSKYVIAHELGHTMQAALLGGVVGGSSYWFQCPGGTCDKDNPIYGRVGKEGLVDPPLMDPICGCQHVRSANALHCLQSIENAERAHTEGFAQFFSSFVWNSPGHGTCRFNYYKEFLDVGTDSCRVRRADGSVDPNGCLPYALDGATAGTISLPPMGVDCGSAHKWRNQNRCAVDSAAESIQKSSMGVEMDWMTFLFEVSRQVGFGELVNLHKAACRPEDITMNCQIPIGEVDGRTIYDSGLPIAWLDGPLGGTIQPDGSVAGAKEHGGIFNGAIRRFGGDDPRTNFVLDRGNLHGVSEDTAPIGP